MDITFTKHAKYGFTLESEVKKNLELLPDEKIMFQTKIRCGPFLGVYTPPGIIAITNLRIALIKHNAFWFDIFYSLAWKDIENILLKEGSSWEKFNGMPSKIHIEYENNSVQSVFTFFIGKGWNMSSGVKYDEKETESLYNKTLALKKIYTKVA